MVRKFSSFRELTEDFAMRDGVALRFAGEDDTEWSELSYADLAAMIEKKAAELASGAGGVQLIRAGQSVDTVVSIFAHVTAGHDVLLADPMVPDEAVSFALAAAADAREARMEAAIAADGSGGAVSAWEGEILFFTSGTTSRSKIVRLTSESLCTSAWSGQSMLACGPDDVLLSVLPLSHVFGFVCSLLWGLCYGAVVALGRGVRHMVDDSLFYDPTIIPAVPNLMNVMLRFGTLNPGLRVVLIGAAPCKPDVTTELRKKGIAVYLGYGLTETSSGIAITQDLDEPEALYACPGADIQIEKDGEVTVATPCMMQGYIGAGRALRKGRFYTGDLGWFDDRGRLHLRGRKKDVLIMSDGTKIFCPEYEEELSQKTGLPDLGIVMKDGRAVLVAGSCPADPAISAGIKRKLQKEIAAYNKELLRSQQIYDIFVTADALPRTVTGKLKRYELQAQYE